MANRINRRRFLKESAAAMSVAGVGYLSCRAAAEPKSPNEKLNIGIIGVAGRGGSNLNDVKGENIVALCDIDDRHLDRTKRQFGDAQPFNDFRKLLDSPKGLDAVVISTTDMTHAPAAIMAMKQGLHVYCEKPLAHTVHEARMVRETYLARQDKIATQMGTQIHATDNYRRVVELVQSGAIGNVTEAHVWCNRMSSQSPPPSGEAPTPSYLHWDTWLGPAPARPYQNGWMPGNLTWNRYWDFGNGIIGDMGSHLNDLPYWALDLQLPATAKADAPEPNPVLYPVRLTVTWTHAKRGDGPHQQACKLIWYDGEAKPNNLLGVDVSGYGIGALFVGETGKLLADYGRRTVLPNDGPAQPNAVAKDQFIPASRGHHAEWIWACKNDPKATLCNFDYSGRLIENNLLGTVSHRVGNKLIEWDAANQKVTNVPEANQFVTKKYREGWGELVG